MFAQVRCAGPDEAESAPQAVPRGTGPTGVRRYVSGTGNRRPTAAASLPAATSASRPWTTAVSVLLAVHPSGLRTTWSRVVTTAFARPP